MANTVSAFYQAHTLKYRVQNAGNYVLGSLSAVFASTVCSLSYEHWRSNPQDDLSHYVTAAGLCALSTGFALYNFSKARNRFDLTNPQHVVAAKAMCEKMFLPEIVEKFGWEDLFRYQLVSAPRFQEIMQAHLLKKTVPRREAILCEARVGLCRLQKGIRDLYTPYLNEQNYEIVQGGQAVRSKTKFSIQNSGGIKRLLSVGRSSDLSDAFKKFIGNQIEFGIAGKLEANLTVIFEKYQEIQQLVVDQTAFEDGKKGEYLNTLKDVLKETLISSNKLRKLFFDSVVEKTNCELGDFSSVGKAILDLYKKIEKTFQLYVKHEDRGPYLLGLKLALQDVVKERFRYFHYTGETIAGDSIIFYLLANDRVNGKWLPEALQHLLMQAWKIHHELNQINIAREKAIAAYRELARSNSRNQGSALKSELDSINQKESFVKEMAQQLDLEFARFWEQAEEDDSKRSALPMRPNHS